MPFFSSIQKFKGQDYYKLKKECQQRDNLFYDLEFPPEDKALFKTPGKIQGVVWKRPKDILANPKLFVGGASAGDVTQGRLGNCWFVAACSCLAQYKEVWHRVIPDHNEQEWDDSKPANTYRGIFHFNFWRFGEWIDIVIDDFLPTVNDELIFVHSQSRNEFWSALLEKAYAKLHGCYEALDGGEIAEALEDFTGGVSNSTDLIKEMVAVDLDARTTLFERMLKEMDRKSLMTAAIPATSHEEMEARTDIGLVKGHAYGITSVKNVPLEGTGIFGIFNQDKLPMVRLRNPWGKGEWKGAFSDGSKEWSKIDESDRSKIGLTFDEDGEFWMTFEDFCKHFMTMAICRIVNTSIFSITKTWHEGIANGSWAVNMRSGGCVNNKSTFLQNPQYTFTVESETDDVMIQLMQKSARGSGSENLTIGFTVMRVEENRQYRVHKPQHIVTSSVFKNGRSMFMRHMFTRGRYVVIACTFDPGQIGEFLLRLYTSTANYFKPLLQEKPVKAWYNCCGRKPQLVTQVKVIKAVGLEKMDRSGGADPYCIISCEGESVTSQVLKDTLNPEWNCAAIFYRKKPIQAPIKVQIWNSNLIKDEHMGKHVFMFHEECSERRLEVDLQGRKSKNNEKRPGKVIVEITISRNLVSL